jgi:hypothetical protein
MEKNVRNFRSTDTPPAPPEGGGPSDEPRFMGVLRSRKFWAALVGLGLVIVKAYQPDFPIAEEQLTSLVYVLVAYILGVALEDGLSHARTA